MATVAINSYINPKLKLMERGEMKTLKPLEIQGMIEEYLQRTSVLACSLLTKTWVNSDYFDGKHDITEFTRKTDVEKVTSILEYVVQQIKKQTPPRDKGTVVIPLDADQTPSKIKSEDPFQVGK